MITAVDTTVNRVLTYSYWFLEIAFVWKGLCVCVCVCVCACVRTRMCVYVRVSASVSRLLITSSMMWHYIQIPDDWLNKFYSIHGHLQSVLLVGMAFELKHVVGTNLIRVS